MPSLRRRPTQRACLKCGTLNGHTVDCPFHIKDIVTRRLADRFIIPPFSVMDTRQGYWTERKAVWLSLGIKSELGRGEALTINGKGELDINVDRDAYRHAERVRERGLLDVSPNVREGYPVQPPRSGPEAAYSSPIDAMYGRNDYAPGKEAVSFNSQDRLIALQRTGSSVVGEDNPRDHINQNLPEETRRALGVYMAEGGAIDRNTGISGTSVFDPVLCELAYRWFCPPNGYVLDPFAGGSVRGIVAAVLGRNYTGIDLSEPQITANRTQWDEIRQGLSNTNLISWLVGDSTHAASLAPGEYDFIFSCPPYADLEVYSNDPRDISNMPYGKFLEAYRVIIRESLRLLKPNRFACFVVSEVRDPKTGFYRNLVANTIGAFERAGAHLYNDAVLINVAGSLPLRAGIPFTVARKLGRMHQNILVFCNGDPKLATEAIGDFDSNDLEDSQ